MEITDVASFKCSEKTSQGCNVDSSVYIRVVCLFVRYCYFLLLHVWIYVVGDMSLTGNDLSSSNKIQVSGQTLTYF